MPFYVFSASQASITVSVAPENPAPGEDTTVTLGSYENNLDSVLITWYVSGAQVSSQIGQKSISVKAPAAGSETSVRAVIHLPDGTLEKKVTIRASVMVLLYESTDSYIPPFYRGKAMPSAGSEIKIVAMPEVRTKAGTISPKNLVYTWQKNYTNDAEESGYGKNSFIYTNDYLEDADTIGVTASTVDGQYSSDASLTVGPSSPQISFYKYSDTLGTLWEKSIQDGYRIQGDEVLIAEPYFISPKEIQIPSLVWNWFINDTQIYTPVYRKNSIPLTVQGGNSGESRLRVEIENNEQLLGSISKELTVEF